MKKTATILMGLALSVSALAACGNKKNKHELPERDEFGYKIEFEKTYSGRDALKCQKNLYEQLTSKNLVGMKGSMYGFDKIAPFMTQEFIEEGSIDIYSNGVIISDMDYTQIMLSGGTKYISKSTTKDEVVFFEDQFIEISTETYDEDDFDYSIDVYEWDNRLDYSAYCEVAGIASNGTYGIDKNGKGYMYYNDITDHSTSGYNKYGVEIDVYDYEITETLVVFEGDPLASKPWGLFYSHYEMAFYDEGYIQTEEPIIYSSQNVEYYPTYGKRKEYKNKEALVQKATTESIEECPYVTLNQYSGVAVDADKKNVTTLPTSYNLVYTYGTTPDMNLKNLQKITGFGETESVCLVADSAIAFNFEIDTEFASYDSTSKRYYEDNDTFEVLTKIKCENLPEGLHIVKDTDGNEYIYAEDDYGYTYIEFEFAVALQKVAEVTVPQVEVTVNFIEY